MEDRELLELAAKAAGFVSNPACYDGSLWGCFESDRSQSYYPWNPLRDGGDALRLAVKLKMDMYFGDDDGTPTVNAGATAVERRPFYYHIEPVGNDPHAATLRAIVRAAAEIGKSM